jgi:ssDNA-binding Zn-finger/Zn-ribbon topoisomerase 1
MVNIDTDPFFPNLLADIQRNDTISCAGCQVPLDCGKYKKSDCFEEGGGVMAKIKVKCPKCKHEFYMEDHERKGCPKCGFVLTGPKAK